MKKHTTASLLGQFIARLRVLPSRLWCWEARFKGVELLGKVEFVGRPLLSVAKGSQMVLGEGVRVASSVRANPLGLFQPSVLRTLEPGARLILGPGVGLSGTVLCAGLSIEIGEETILGAGAVVFDNDFHVQEGQWGWRSEHQRNARPVRIGRGVFIGTRAIVLKGVTIGDRAIVGAGAVVAHDVPPGYTAVGNPARSFAGKVAPVSPAS